jgi:murein DD-endopeptidase MepM/ murein hydrolase activator NlpD
LANNFFIYPTSGRISQGIHYYNAIDVANKCGTPVYAAASGVIQRVKYGYNYGGGNLVTILHTGGIVTYYGHLMTIFVKSGDKVSVGDRIALIGGGTGTAGDGLSTGCHLHFQVMGAANPLAKYSIGTVLSLK